MKVFMLVAVLLSGCANRHFNRTALVVSTVALAWDWSQTRSMAESGWATTSERNPVMGRSPSTQMVDQYFLGVALTNIIVWLAMPERYRAVVPGAVTAAQVHAIHNNVQYTGVFGR